MLDDRGSYAEKLLVTSDALKAPPRPTVQYVLLPLPLLITKDSPRKYNVVASAKTVH